MRCRNCNVDLPDTYTVCPLCSGKASPDEALIGGIRLAEFPDVKTEPYKRDPFPIFMGIWLAASLISLLLFKLQVITQPILAAVVCLVPLVWTLIGRPLMVKQLYAGNFAMMNVYPLTLACLWFGKIHFGDYKTPFASFVPFCFIAVLVALAVIMLVDSKESKRAASYPVLVLPVSLGCFIAASVITKSVAYWWLAVVGLCVLILAVLFAVYPQATKAELAAKFSIQKSVDSHKAK